MKGARASEHDLTMRKSISFAMIGAVLCGMTCGVVAAALACVPKELDASLVISVCTIGMLVATPLAGFLADALGRRRTLTVAALALLASVAFISGGGGSVSFVLAGRFVQGAGVGFLFSVLPLYIGELFPERSRGRGVAFMQFFILLGQVGGAAAGLLMTAALGPRMWLWRVIFSLPAVLAMLFLIGTFVMEDVGAGDGTGGRGLGVSALPELLRDGIRSRFLMTVAVFCMSSALAAGPIMNLSVRLMHDVGVTGVLANSADVVMQAVCLVSTLSAAVTADRIGSRRLLIAGAVGTFAGLLGLAMAFRLPSAPLAAVSLWVFAASYCFGPGVCIFLLMNELLPERVRAVGASVALLANHAVSAAVAAVFTTAVSDVGHCGVFLFLSAVALAFAAFARWALPRRMPS